MSPHLLMRKHKQAVPKIIEQAKFKQNIQNLLFCIEGKLFKPGIIFKQKLKEVFQKVDKIDELGLCFLFLAGPRTDMLLRQYPNKIIYFLNQIAHPARLPFKKLRLLRHLLQNKKIKRQCRQILAILFIQKRLDHREFGRMLVQPQEDFRSGHQVIRLLEKPNGLFWSKATFFGVGQEEVSEEVVDEDLVAENLVLDQEDHHVLLHERKFVEEAQKVVDVEKVEVAEAEEVKCKIFVKCEEVFEVFKVLALKLEHGNMFLESLEDQGW